MKCETKYEDMVDIMNHNQQNVKKDSSKVVLTNPEIGVDLTLYENKFHYILFGGDQLTVERARGSKRVRSNSIRGRDHLEGLLPVVVVPGI